MKVCPCSIRLGKLMTDNYRSGVSFWRASVTLRVQLNLSPLPRTSPLLVRAQYGQGGVSSSNREIYCMSTRLYRHAYKFGVGLTFECSLAAVNFFLGCVGVTQVTRILLHQQSVKKATPSQVAEANAKDASDTAKAVLQDPKGAAKNAVQ